ncbi:hypothetical protein [Streptomyces sp. NPDC088350]|uniref:hypothetical protein n=1 Tax=Streptomyces sp. NPDC088350 TaxID=3365854 RepID=UPI0038198E60
MTRDPKFRRFSVHGSEHHACPEAAAAPPDLLSHAALVGRILELTLAGGRETGTARAEASRHRP